MNTTPEHEPEAQGAAWQQAGMPAHPQADGAPPAPPATQQTVPFAAEELEAAKQPQQVHQSQAGPQAAQQPQQVHQPQQLQQEQAAQQQTPTVPQMYAPHPHSAANARSVYEAPQPSFDFAFGVQNPAAPAFEAAPQHQRATAGKGRTGLLLAGLAVGALLGGVVGGGVAAVVSHNSVSQQTAQGVKSGAITLNNADNATQISGVAAVAMPSVVTVEVNSATAAGSGSGVIYKVDGNSGYIISNAHVVTLDGAAKDARIRVRLSEGRIFDGEVQGIAPYSDISVIKIEADNLQAVDIADSDDLNVGDLTVAIGAPLNLANTVTSGVVSALNRGISVGSALVPQDSPSQDEPDNGGGRPWDFRFGLPDEGQPQEQQSGGTVTLPVVQTDASINPGNSGGALLNGNGELIGINVAIASPTSSADGTAGSAGLGFAIPSNLAKRIADQIVAGEKPSHGLLGASVGDSTQDTDADANVAGGLLVDVSKGGAAAKAGLRAGDVITAIDGVPADSGTTVSALVREHAGGDKVTIDFSRGGQARQTEATLGTLDW